MVIKRFATRDKCMIEVYWNDKLNQVQLSIDDTDHLVSTALTVSEIDKLIRHLTEIQLIAAIPIIQI
jgi:hypothetical protein